MSAGTRITLAQAKDAAAFLMGVWKMDPADCMVVGSVRRGKADVGDLELVAPCPVDPGRDELYRLIKSMVESETPDMFAPQADVTHGRALKGLKPGFLACSLEMRITHPETGVYSLPVQIFRYSHDRSNRGWCEVCRTGPREFGKAFLARWHRQHQIPHDKQASMDGFLVDGYGERVKVPTERIAFELCGLSYIEPEKREAMVTERVQGGVR